MSYAGIFTDKNNMDHPVTSTLYGTCATAANEAAKVVVCTDFDTLLTGVTIRVKFANANTAASPTVNINSTGAKSVYRFGSTAPVDGDSWKAGEVVDLLYDGTSFFMVSADDIGSKQDALTFDDTPTDNSNNPVKSNGIYDALATKANTDMVAADFNAGTSYTAGNYCIYEGKFYKFKNNHSGAWSAADVDEIKISGELSALKSGLTSVISSIVFSIYDTHDAAPFDEDGSGVVLAIKDNSTVLGYMVIRPKNYNSPSNDPNAIELYNASWEGIWSIQRQSS